jgi:hypothetical protein
MLFNSTGILSYHRSEGGGYKLVVEADKEIGRYYRSLIPKWIRTNAQMYDTHISVVRKEVPPKAEHWGKYAGQPVEFQYENIIRQGKVYFWLNAFCVRLEEIRAELGLPVHSPYTLPPEGFSHCFHITVANVKGV